MTAGGFGRTTANMQKGRRFCKLKILGKKVGNTVILDFVNCTL